MITPNDVMHRNTRRVDARSSGEAKMQMLGPNLYGNKTNEAEHKNGFSGRLSVCQQATLR